MKQIFAWATRSQFARHAMMLMVGTGIAQLIAIGTSPLIARLYTPSDFGVFALYLSWVTIASALATGRYDVAQMLPADHEKARAIAVGAVLICAATSVILFALSLAFARPVALLLHEPRLTTWLYVAPFAILLTGVTSTYNYWRNRATAYRLLASSRIAQAATTASLSIGLARLWQTGGLFVASLVGQTVVAATVIYRAKLRPPRFDAAFRKSMVAALRDYKSFPLVSIPNDVINLLSTHLPRFLIGSFFGSAALGVFFLTQRILDLPLALVAGSVRDVFNQRANLEFQSTGSCHRLFLITARNLFLIAVGPSLLVFALAPATFAWVFGETWRDAGYFARILAPLYFLRFCISPLCVLFYTAQKQHRELVWQVVLLGLTFLSFWLGVARNDLTIGLICYSTCYSIMYLIIFFMALRLAKGLPADRANDARISAETTDEGS